MAVAEMFPRFLETLSGALLDFFETVGKIIETEEEDDKKN
jgi:hypothetical protein